MIMISTVRVCKRTVLKKVVFDKDIFKAVAGLAERHGQRTIRDPQMYDK